MRSEVVPDLDQPYHQLTLVFHYDSLNLERRVLNSSRHDFASSTSLSRDPLAEVWIAIRQRNASRFALSKKSHAILTGQSQLLEVKNDAAIFPFGGDERFQFDDVLFVDPAA
ncbi:MAG: hypothetical protein ABSE57_07840 [Bryobacteraceae bacterium]